jgi:plastocyanin domain-containing protein
MARQKITGRPVRMRTQRRFFKLMLPLSLVTFLGGLLLIGCTEKPAKITLNEEGVAEVAIRVEHGFHPGNIVVPANHSVRLSFTRNESEQKSCMDTLLIPSEDVKIELPPKTTQIVALKSRPAGTKVSFSCGMRMVSGNVTFQ